MELTRAEEIDSLARLEERIQKAAELVAQLRGERDAAVKERDAAVAARDASVKEAADARARITAVTEELETLRKERAQVRTRVEKLLGQMDLLSTG